MGIFSSKELDKRAFSEGKIKIETEQTGGGGGSRSESMKCKKKRNDLKRVRKSICEVIGSIVRFSRRKIGIVRIHTLKV
jgi:hypothetical protein